MIRNKIKRTVVISFLFITLDYEKDDLHFFSLFWRKMRELMIITNENTRHYN
jgi:hypothetical protein